MKTPIEMLNAIIEMQEANYGNATNTHLALSTLVEEAKETVKNCSKPESKDQSEQLCRSPSHRAMKIGLQDECADCGEKS